MSFLPKVNGGCCPFPVVLHHNRFTCMDTSYKKPSFHGPSPRQASLITGFALILMFFAAMVAEFGARQSLIVADDAAATAGNILAHPLSFRIGFLAFLLVGILDVVVAYSLYVFFQPANDALAQLAAWLRMLYVALLGAALPGLLMGFRLLQGGGVASSAVQDQALAAFNSFEDVWMTGMIFFGLHLLVVGYLALKSGLVPRVIGILLMAAGICYALDSTAFLSMANYAAYKAVFKAVVAIPGIAGELGLAIWLLVRGGRHTPEPA